MFNADSLIHRQLDHYPATAERYRCLGITVAATVLLYYELYVNGAVATSVIRDFHMTFGYYVGILVIGNALGAFGSLAAGLADRWGRANLVTYGLLITGLLTTFAVPNVGTKASFGVVYALVAIAEGVVLVATPALVRDFSPQLGRASAMGFWTLGPVVGSLITTEVSSQTLDDAGVHWRHQFVIAGIVGLVVFVIALLGLRELSPGLRDQTMVSLEDRAAIEAHASEAAVRTGAGFGKVLSPRLLAPALGISVYLLFYYTAVAFFVIFLETVEGASAPHANHLLNFYWASNAISLVVFGWLSDKLRVRKPLMIVGGIGSIVVTASVISQTGSTPASDGTLELLLLLTGLFGGLAFAPWMAAFTENVEARDPGLTATGLAAWGWILRAIVAIGFALLPQVISSATPLVETGAQAQELQVRYASQLTTAQALSPATQAALAKDPTAAATQAEAIHEVAAAEVAARKKGAVAIPAADAARALALLARYPDEIATAKIVDFGTQAALLINPKNTDALAKAVTEIVASGVDQTTAEAKLAALAKVPSDDLVFLSQSGAAVEAVGAELTAVSTIPAADLVLLQKAQKAQADAPDEWKDWFWICLGGQVAFLLLVLVVEGPWTPARAKVELQERRAALVRA